MGLFKPFYGLGADYFFKYKIQTKHFAELLSYILVLFYILMLFLWDKRPLRKKFLNRFCHLYYLLPSLANTGYDNSYRAQ